LGAPRWAIFCCQISDGNDFDTRIFQRGHIFSNLKIDTRCLGTLGKFRLTGWKASVIGGSFGATLANPFLSDRRFNPGRQHCGDPETRSEFGFIGNVEQPPPMI